MGADSVGSVQPENARTQFCNSSSAKELYELHFRHGVAIEVLKQLVLLNRLPSEQKVSAAAKEVGCCLADLVMFLAGCFPANGLSRAL